MIEIVELDSLTADPLVQKFALRRDSEWESTDEMIIDSERVIQRAVNLGIRPKAILLTPQTLERHRPWLSKGKDCKIFVATEKLIESLVGSRVHQTMMAIADRPKHRPLSSIGPSAIFLNSNNDPQNVGSIIRSCHAFNVSTVMYDRQTCSPYARRSIRVSMGSVFWTNNVFVEDTPTSLEQLKRQGYQIVAAHLGPQSQSLRGFRFQEPTVLVIGQENSGVSKDILALCDAFVKIDTSESIDSLNAASAASILLYELSRA
ncbi:MAG: RNA methyltransferase [Proteobacteria bacterium]|nr:RNA methyltransferase [Pseudomonadota bacterium]